MITKVSMKELMLMEGFNRESKIPENRIPKEFQKLEQSFDEIMQEEMEKMTRK